MTCHIDHSHQDAIPAALCRGCHPELIPTAGAREAQTVREREALSAAMRRQALMREVGRLRGLIGQCERAEARGGDKHGISQKKLRSYTRQLAQVEQQLASLEASTQ